MTISCAPHGSLRRLICLSAIADARLSGQIPAARDRPQVDDDERADE
jgi:hypothetical protein